jgi:hemerythrin
VAKIFWTNQLSVGIEVIDSQHRRIVDYINLLDDALSNGHTRKDIGILINDLVDYTISHFGFEESLQDEAAYPFIKAHKKVHVLFTKRVADFQARFDNGEDISEELHNVLVTWLLNHIKYDDADYVQSVKKYLDQQPNYVEKKKGFFSRLFA